MKIRIITHHSVFNHGAILQLFALKSVLSTFDNSVCALEYTKNYDFYESFANVKYNISLKSIPFYLGYLREKGLGRTFFNVKKKHILDAFRSKTHVVGEYYSRCKDMDAVFVGSDEVFSIEAGLNPCFWGMGVPVKHMFAYGGCFGPTTIDFIRQKYSEEYIKAGIERFEKISVRDMNSHDIIQKLSGLDVPQVCDPVILYGYQKEKELFKRPCKDKYLLVYSYDENMNDPEEVRCIQNYAKAHDLKIFSVGFYHKWCDRNINVDPFELLNWVDSAEVVVTDTFHGTVMSLVMNTDFAVKIRGNRNKLGFLLEEYGVLSREIHDFSTMSAILDEKIDFATVNNIISNKRKEGLAFIDSCIEEVGNV